MSEWSSATHWRGAGVPKRHAMARETGGAAEWAAKLAQVTALLGTGCLVALVGPRGTGKTQLAVELIREVTGPRDLPARYTTATEFFMALKETFGDEAKVPASKVLAGHRAVNLLVLDEVHERGATSWEDQMLTTLIDMRYRDLKDTVLIANLKPDEFLTHVGPSIASRLQETGCIVECKWKSFRAK